MELLKMAPHHTLYHHERYEGTGYSENLKGDNISANLRMMAIENIFDAIAYKRAYKGAVTIY